MFSNHYKLIYMDCLQCKLNKKSDFYSPLKYIFCFKKLIYSVILIVNLCNIYICKLHITEMFATQMALVRQYGKLFKLWMGNRLVIVLTDPKILEQLLSSNEHITKSVGYDGFKPYGLVNSGGDYWRKHRKIITPAFHFKILETFVQYIRSNSYIMMSILEKNVNEKSLDIHPIISNYYLDTISGKF